MANAGIVIFDTETGNFIERDLTANELADIEASRNKRAASEAAEAAFVKDRADGLAKLEAAGLTPAQAKAVARKDK